MTGVLSDDQATLFRKRGLISLQLSPMCVSSSSSGDNHDGNGEPAARCSHFGRALPNMHDFVCRAWYSEARNLVARATVVWRAPAFPSAGQTTHLAVGRCRSSIATAQIVQAAQSDAPGLRGRHRRARTGDELGEIGCEDADVETTDRSSDEHHRGIDAAADKKFGQLARDAACCPRRRTRVAASYPCVVIAADTRESSNLRLDEAPVGARAHRSSIRE